MVPQEGGSVARQKRGCEVLRGQNAMAWARGVESEAWWSEAAVVAVTGKVRYIRPRDHGTMRKGPPLRYCSKRCGVVVVRDQPLAGCRANHFAIFCCSAWAWRMEHGEEACSATC